MTVLALACIDTTQACEQYAREHFSKEEIQGKIKPMMSSKDLGDGKEGL